LNLDDIDAAIVIGVVFAVFILVSFVYAVSLSGSVLIGSTLNQEKEDLRQAKCAEKLGDNYATGEVSKEFVCFNKTELITPSVSISELHSHVSGLEEKALWPGKVASSLPATLKTLLNMGAFLGLLFIFAMAFATAPGKHQRL